MRFLICFFFARFLAKILRGTEKASLGTPMRLEFEAIDSSGPVLDDAWLVEVVRERNRQGCKCAGNLLY